MSLSAFLQAPQASFDGARHRNPSWARHNEPFSTGMNKKTTAARDENAARAQTLLPRPASPKEPAEKSIVGDT